MFGLRHLEDVKEGLEKEILELNLQRKGTEEALDLETQIKVLRREKQQLIHENKMANEDIKHMIKMKEERLKLEFTKKEVELIKEKDETIMAIKVEYQRKVELSLKQELEKAGKMYETILARLPDISVRMKGTI